uniref:Uncharacterized protein n=1 Tax=Anopheles maculatus TaxID=74869 RepID=A0A182SSC3_9DIPT
MKNNNVPQHSEMADLGQQSHQHQQHDPGQIQITDLRHQSLNEILKNNMEIMKPSGHHDHDHHHQLHTLHHGYDDHHPGMDCTELVGTAGDNNNNRRSDSNNNHAAATTVTSSQHQQLSQRGIAHGGSHATPGTATSAGTTAANSAGDCDDDLSKSQLILIDDERSSLHDDDDEIDRYSTIDYALTQFLDGALQITFRPRHQALDLLGFGVASKG